MIDRREQIRIFHARVNEALTRAEVNRSELARRAGVDRSTLSQLLMPGAGRLPRADTAAAIAVALGVSLDWLLGLSSSENPQAEIIDRGPDIDEAERSPADARMIAWHQEAAGYKIRYVPANLPDMLKTEGVVRYEYADFQGLNPDQAQGRTADQLEYARLPETDIEICSSIQSFVVFADGSGIWEGLAAGTRRDQLLHMAGLLDELYPTLRMFLFDGLTTYATPVTIFGPHRAALYLGDIYFSFNNTEHVRVLTRLFDNLIRNATVQPTDMGAFLTKLADTVRDD